MDAHWQAAPRTRSRLSIGLALGGLLLLFFVRSGGLGLLPGPCLILSRSSVPCPMCGFGQSWQLVLAGAPLPAVIGNPLGGLSALLSVAVCIWLVLDVLRPLPRPVLVLQRNEAVLAAGGLLALLVTNWLYTWLRGGPW